MLNNRLDVLNLEWPDSDRDLHIVTPTLVYLEKKYNLKYKTKSIFNGYYYILKYRPKILILSNFVGAGVNYKIASMANNIGIKTISFISEGNFKEEELDLYLYGKDYKNRKNNFVVDKYFLWNQKSKNLILTKYPALKSYIQVTGATGFDRYKLLKFIDKTTFLNTHTLKYSKIIGIAGWAFGIFFNEDREYYLDNYGEEQVLMHCNDLNKVNTIYKNIIKSNPDILFILRYHPATSVLKEDEFFNLEKYDNVFISSSSMNNEYSISELINICDLWIGYETTTALEAWLLQKQTFLINPTRSDFIRENVHKGSPIVKNEIEAQGLIAEYYMHDSILKFKELIDERKAIIKETIEYDDGQNYIRTAEEILKVFNKPNKQINLPFKIYMESFKQIIKIVLSKTIMKKRWPELNYKTNFEQPYKSMYDEVIHV